MPSSCPFSLLMAVSAPTLWLLADFDIVKEGTTADSVEVGLFRADPD
jgi:hypothetical protein